MRIRRGMAVAAATLWMIIFGAIVVLPAAIFLTLCRICEAATEAAERTLDGPDEKTKEGSS